MMIFLSKHNKLPVNMFLHSKTRKRVWVYEVDEYLSQLLTQWTSNRYHQ